MHGPRGFSCVRYNANDENWEMFCEGCKRRGLGKTFHALDHAWWDISNMSACRACLKLDKAAWIKNKRATDPEFKAQQDAASLANKRLKNATYKRNARARRKGQEEWLTPLPYRPIPIRITPAIRIVTTTSPQKGSEPILGRVTTATPAITSPSKANTRVRAGASADTAAMGLIAAQSSATTQ